MKTQVQRLRGKIEDSIIGIIIIALLIAGGIIFYNSRASKEPVGGNVDVVTETPDYTGLTISSVFTQDSVVGKGPAAKKGSVVNLSYSLWVYDPKKFANRGDGIEGDSSPVQKEIKIGEGQSIFGELESNLEGLKSGTKRNMVVPPSAISVLKLNKTVPSGLMLMFEIETQSVSQ